MSLLIWGYKSKVKASEIQSVNISSVIGLTTDFQTYIDPNQTNSINNLIWNINIINNNISNLTNEINNNESLDITQNNILWNINNLINDINNTILNIQTNKSDVSYVNNQIILINKWIVFFLQMFLRRKADPAALLLTRKFIEID